ncbi:MAG: acetyl-CoA carboxylase biotin carboxyl carrier protein [Candidatus Meridianibacter frigidus]|nr:MAG: acetyl-CoA carboxylase biotin carboxyl carrier protein [Candidatus Eremiobacteraeota bacterium]
MADETEKIKELLEIMREHDLDALKVKLGEQIFELVRREPGVAPIPGQPAAQPERAEAHGEEQAAASPTVRRVTAPLVGIFYRSAAPGVEPFVEVGDRVQTGDALCILEAMKLMNEITSDYAGVVTRIIPENGQLVSLGEEMFWIEP